MSSELIHSFDTFEDTARALLARVYHPDGSIATQSNTSAITWAAYEVASDGTGSAVTGANGSLTVSDVIYDTLQTDAIWDEDETGYNFKWVMPSTAIPEGGKKYRIQVIITPTLGATYKHALSWMATTLELYGQ